jgi:O-antigen/teichoic acid export membrane protein
VSRNVDNVLVAGLLGASTLAFYSVAYRLMLIPVILVSAAVARVAVPTLRRVAEAGRGSLRAETLTLLSAVCFVSVPVLATVYVYSDAVVGSLYGPGWGLAAGALRILVLAAFCQVVTGIVAAALQASTNMRALWWSNVIYAPLVAGGAALGATHGLRGVCIAYAVISGLNLGWHMALARKSVGFTCGWLWSGLTPSFLPATCCLLAGVLLKRVVETEGLLVVAALGSLAISFVAAATVSDTGRRATLSWLHMLGLRTAR